MKKCKINIWIALTAGICLIVFAGCAGTRPNMALVSARTAYERASASADVTDNAPVELHEAEKALKRAELAEEEADITRLSDLAEKQVKYAVMVGEQKAAEKQIETLDKEQQKIMLDSRQKEIEKKAQEIELARQDVEEAQQKTILMKDEAEKARKEAEAKSLEAKLAQEKAEMLAREIEELKAKKTERGLVLTLGDVLFSSGKSALMPGAMRTIDNLAEFLQKNSDRNILIEGHTDNVGKDSYNLDLSRMRANSVKTALLARGISTSRMTIQGYGETRPVADNTSGSGRQQNRRVEIIILDAGVSPESAILQ